MSSALPTPEASAPDAPQSTPSPTAQSTKPNKVPACALCQQRKVKCDRQYPCSNCLKSGAQCVQPTPRARQARRHFPHREILGRLGDSEKRLRQYEELLRRNNIMVEAPPTDPPTGESSLFPDGGSRADSRHPESAGSGSTDIPGKEYLVRNFWNAMSLKYRDADEESSDSDSSQGSVHRTVVNRAWDHEFEGQDNTLLGVRKEAVELSALHPEPAQIFMLWQVYLDNVNPLLKVTHYPSLQERIVKAASNLKAINSNLEALMFSIYSISILSLAEDECLTMFGNSKQELLTRYQSACQQSLIRCGFLRSSDRHCLTALHLYLISVRPRTDPRSLASMLGMALRVAQRMGLHNESTNARFPALEAEMRRRLWWSIILFDTRIGEMVDHKNVSLTPTWDCRTPLNVNDADLRSGMKEAPVAVQESPTEAIFTVVRSEMGNLLRYSNFHLQFTNPALKCIVVRPGGSSTTGSETDGIEKVLEEKYLKFCNPENPVHYITTWLTRSYFAKFRLVEHYAKYSPGSLQTNQTDAQCDAALSYSLDWLQCDTKVLAAPFTKGFLWLLHGHFPFPAYVSTTQDLKRRPLSKQAEKAWEIMSENYKARFVSDRPYVPRYTDGGISSAMGGPKSPEDGPLLSIFSKMVQQAWDARKTAFGAEGENLTPPMVVTTLRDKAAQYLERERAWRQAGDTSQPPDVLGMGQGMYDFQMPTTTGYDSLNMFYGIPGQEVSPLGSGPDPDPNLAEQALTDPNLAEQALTDPRVDQLTWATMDWVLDQWLV